MSPRIHYDAGQPGGPVLVGLCGWSPRDVAHLSTEPGDVTCKACRRELRRRHIGRAAAPATSAPFEPGPPVERPRQRWEMPGPRIVRASISGDDRGPDTWHTITDAMRSWYTITSGSLVSSTSRQERFQGAAGPRSDHTPSVIDRRARVIPVGRAITTACAAGRSFAGGEDGRGALELGADDCMFVVVGYLADRPAADIAARLASKLGMSDDEITSRHVGLVWRGVRRAVECDLRARRLLTSPPRVHNDSAADERRRGGDVAALPDGYDVDGWKAVASATGYSESHCRALARSSRDPLPVSEMRGRIIARSHELRAWIARQVRPKSGAA